MSSSSSTAETQVSKVVKNPEPKSLEPGPLIKLQAADGEIFEVPKNIASLSITIKGILADISSDFPVPLPNVPSKMLTKVIEYLRYHFEHPAPPKEKEEREERRLDDIIPWDEEFCKVDRDTIFTLINVANYLEIQPLLDLACKTVAIKIKGKTPDEIRAVLDIKSDLTPEQEERIRKENEYKEEDD